MSVCGLPKAHGADAAIDLSVAARTRTFHTLDALRGIAAIAVVLFHTAFFYGIATPAEGQMAVDLFFVMSGFIIAYRYDRDLRSGLGVCAFLKLRLIRLYPLYLLGMLLGVVPIVVALAAGEIDQSHLGFLKSVPFHLLMLPSRFVPRLEVLYPLNYVAWSLALEIVVNVAYAATFRVWTIARLVVLLGVAALALCICDWTYGSLIGGFDWANAPTGVARILFGFPMGVLIYRLHARGRLTVRVPWWVLLVAAAALFVFDAPVAKPLWELAAVTMVIPLIVVAAVVNEPPPAARPACAMAGVYSYVLYSLHAPLVGWFLRGEERLHLDLKTCSSAKLVALTVLFVVVCILAHHVYDRPVRRYLAGWSKDDPPGLGLQAGAAAKS